MRNGKKIIVFMIILLVIVVMAIAVFAHVYTSTDIFKTDKEMFVKYFNQLTLENTLKNAQIEQYNQKKKQNSYENSGEITVEVEYPNESLEDIMEKVNDLSISFSGKVDSQNEKVEQNIEVDYGNNVIFPITYKQDKDTYGLKIEKVSKQYIAVREDEIEELLLKIISTANVEDEPDFFNSINTTSQKVMGIVQTINSIDKEIFDKIKLTQEEENKLKQIYGDVLKEQLPEESFSSLKNGKKESYTLELTYEQIKNIIIKMLETTKENPLLIDKLNEIILEQEPESEKIEPSMVDELIKVFEENETTEIPNLKITLGLENKKLNEIIIKLGENTLSISTAKTEDTISYSIEFKAKENVTNFSMQYLGLKSLDNVQENYELGFKTVSEDENMKFVYKINSNTEFNDSVSIDEIDEDSALFLNDYEKENVDKFLKQMWERISQINKTQMEELGLNEDQNPLLYSNPITLLVISFVNMDTDSVTNGEKFTVNVDSENRIVIYEQKENRKTEKNLKSDSIKFFSNISEKWLPENINNESEGSHNGSNYIAYTFYAENMGQHTINYRTTIEIEDVSNDVDEAIRIMVFKNDNKVVYAKNNKETGEPEPDTIPFYNEEIIMLENRNDFKPGDIDKYTIVIWIEGDDPNCTNKLIGGSIKTHMNLKEEK